MKNWKKNSILMIAGILALVMTACAPQVAETPVTALPAATEALIEEAPAVEAAPETAVPPAEESPVEAPTVEIDVEALIVEKLESHHDVNWIWDANFDRAKWEATIDRMIGYGAKISPEEKQIIIDYLLSRNP